MQRHFSIFFWYLKHYANKTEKTTLLQISFTENQNWTFIFVHFQNRPRFLFLVFMRFSTF